MNANPPTPGNAGTRAWILVLLILSASLVAALFLPIPTPLSESDVQRITELVRQETDEPILTIRARRLFRVEVTTGTIRGGFDANGHEFRLRWGIGGWKIYRGTSWFS